MFKKKLFLLVLMFCLQPAFSAPPKNKIVVPDDIDGATTINAEGLIDLVQNVPGLVILDSRITDDRTVGYIEGSISLPDIKTDCKSLKKKVSGKTAPVLFYCNGTKCGRSVNATRKALECGYSNLYWFRGGFEEWKAKDYPYLVE